MKRRILMLFLLVSVCLCAFFSLFSLGLFLPQRFAAAQSQWEASDIQDYEIIVGVGTFSELSQYRIVVRDGNIVEAGRRFPPFVLPTELTYDPDSFTPVPPTQAESYTLDALMRRASETVGNAPIFEFRACDTYWDADYDSQYGYVRSLRFHCAGGLLGCTIGDCDGGYSVLNFTPLS